MGLTHVFKLVIRDDDVGFLYDILEVLEHEPTIDLKFKDISVNLIDNRDGLNLLIRNLSEDGLNLDTNTFEVIDDDRGTTSKNKVVIGQLFFASNQKTETKFWLCFRRFSASIYWLV